VSQKVFGAGNKDIKEAENPRRRRDAKDRQNSEEKATQGSEIANGQGTCGQSDRIGRIFASRAVVFFRQSFENYRSIPNIGLLFNTLKFLCFNFDEKWILGDFFTNSLGHPAFGAQ
jgi:hypothetical protein